VANLASRGQPPGSPPGDQAVAMALVPPQVPPVGPAWATAPRAVGSPGNGQFSDDGRHCCWEDSDCWEDTEWDPAGSLTAREIATLAALDRAGGADDADVWDEGRCDAAPMALRCSLAGPWLPGDQLDSPPGGEPVEALPGLMPRHLGTGGGFDAGGVADRVPPGPALAGLTADKWASGLSRVSDDELAGLMIAWRRVASWAAAGELAAVAELCRRREAQVAAGADAHLAEHVGDEVAMALTLTPWAGGRLVDRAQGLARLPKTMAALAAGEIDVPKALVILSELSGLGDVHASRVEAAVIGRAATWTTGELRRAARRQAIAADPAAARRRKVEAEKLARVERWMEDAGTAALAGRDLPPAGVLAADAYLTAWAKRLKAAGLGGNLDQLRAQVYLALLNGQPPETLLLTGTPSPGTPADQTSKTPLRSGAPSPGSPADADGPSRPTAAADEARDARAGSHRESLRASDAGGPGEPTAAADEARDAGAGSHRDSLRASGPPGAQIGCDEGADASSPAARKPSGPASGRAHAALPSGAPGPALRGSVNLVLPLSTWLGWSLSPGEVAGFGPLDAADSRALAAALARDPATKWCVTVTGSDGRAVAHGCAKAAPGRLSAGPIGHREGPGPPPPPGIRIWLAGVSLAWLETGECSHRRESPGYRPSPALTHLIQIRQVTCIAPGCRRPAVSCDFEHTIPYHQGGRSCECNGGPCCRRHHRAKQASGWQLAQPRPGTFVWTTPHGRSYLTWPEPYLA
jgi:hypothetical protein